MHEQESRLVSERRAEILELLRREGRVLSGPLSAHFGTSEDTIRRDLREMDAAGLLRRVHGGALPRSPVIRPFRVRMTESAAAKRVIGAAAAKLVRNGQVILLDAGSSGVEVARHLPPSLEALVLTNSLAAAQELCGHPTVEVTLIGGSVDKHAGATGGSAALEALERIHADVCFMGVHGLDPRAGFTSSKQEEAALKRKMIERSADAVALATAEKLGTAAPHVVVDAARLTHLVTDASEEAETIEGFRKLGIQVILVGG